MMDGKHDGPPGPDADIGQQRDTYLQQMQRLEALSRLTGGLVHDLNNKLMIINANIDMAAKQIKDRPQVTRKLLSALVAAEQAGTMVSKMLGLFNRHAPLTVHVDVGELLYSVSEMLQRTLLSKGVQLELSIPQALPSVRTDPNEFQTAIVNLVVNSSDAMAGGGMVTIDASPCRLQAGSLPGLALEGDFVRISVQDSGHGIPQDHLQHIFEPFFTTRERKRWRGLGLPQVHRFSVEAGGNVHIDSTVGEGTTVSLYLPRAVLDVQLGQRHLIDETGDDDLGEEPVESRIIRAAREILIVDDEVEVALAVQSMVDKLGYKSRVAIGAEEALIALSERPPSLVLSDIAMRGIDGIALAEAVRSEWPDLPVVLISGNPDISAAGVAFPLLGKPVTDREIASVLKDALAARKVDNIVSLSFGKRKKS